MAKKRKKAPRIDLLTEDMLLAEEDLAAMRPALAVAPELILHAIQDAEKRSARRRSGRKKKATARKSAAKKARKVVPKRKRPVKRARKKRSAKE